jgi:hypothetical protein
MKINYHLFIFIIINFTGCSFNTDLITDISIDDIFSSDYIELNDIPKDSIFFICDNKKSFYLRHSDDEKSVWIIYPKQEIKLMLEGAGNIYSNGFTSLHISPTNNFIKDGSGVLYNNCNEK